MRPAANPTLETNHSVAPGVDGPRLPPAMRPLSSHDSRIIHGTAPGLQDMRLRAIRQRLNPRCIPQDLASAIDIDLWAHVAFLRSTVDIAAHNLGDAWPTKPQEKHQPA